MPGVPLPTALRQCGRVKQDFGCPQPPGGMAVGYTAHCPLPTTTVQQGAHTVQCSVQHQAVRHHTKSTDGAARHAGCSGPMRPCETARRRRQAESALVRLCHNTLAHSAHTTHTAQPVYLYLLVDIPAFAIW